MPSAAPLAFSLNHITCARRDVEGLARLALDLGLTQVEIRNDIAGVALADGTPPTAVARTLQLRDVRAVTVNALQRFNDWTGARATEAEALAIATKESGARALVLCPVNESGYWTNDVDRLAALRTSLAALRPILDRHGLVGLVEPLGFESCSLRYKREAVEAIDAVGGADSYQVLHDTFHHAIAEDPDIFPTRTGLVHISGVTAPDVALADMRDAHRVLIDARDRIDNVGQIAALRGGGYVGLFSIECFADSVQADPDLTGQLAQCMAFIRHSVAL